MSEYIHPDFLSLDAQLSDDQRLIRATVRRFVDERVMPQIAAHFRAGTFPHDLVPEMGALGMFGANLPGGDAEPIDAIAYGLINQELERGDSGPAQLRVGAVEPGACGRSIRVRDRCPAGSGGWRPMAGR
jgi:alkylation response protein AidB-like acyl-CoA dehydrogenase